MTTDNCISIVDMDIDIYVSDNELSDSNPLPILEGMKDPEDSSLRLDLPPSALKKLREFA